MSKERGWVEDENVTPYYPEANFATESISFSRLKFSAHIEISPLLFENAERIATRELAYRMDAHAARHMHHAVEFEWPKGWKEAVKDSFYPWLARWEHRLMPLRSARGAKVAGWLQEKWPVRYEKRHVAVWEWLDKQYLERHQSAIAIEVLKPQPIFGY